MARRVLRGVLPVAAIASGVAGGYLLGSLGSIDSRDAVAARQSAARAALRATRMEILGGGLSRGFEAGYADGKRLGSSTGGQDGGRAGRAAARRARGTQSDHAPHRSRSLGSGAVLVLGDSLEVLTSPYLQRYLPSVPLAISAKGGYSSIQLFDLFEDAYDPAQSVIVFDAGTNDNPAYPSILAARLEAVAQEVGDRCLVVPTIHGLTVNGITSAGKNRVVRAFQASRPGTQVPDWARAVASHPDLLQPDHLHPTADGAQFRAQLIAQAVLRCLEL